MVGGLGRNLRGLPVAALAVGVVLGSCTTSAPTVAPSLPPVAAAVPTSLAPSATSPAPTPTSGPSPIAAPSPSAVALPKPTAAPKPTLPPEFSLHVPVLTYHVIAPSSVASSYSLPGLDLDPTVFDAQLRLLKASGWRSITVDRLSRYLGAKQRPPRKTFVITIDDGHDDGYVYALPILRKYGFVATYYVVVDRVGTDHNLTWDEIRTLRANGMEIGNHTMEHLNLASHSAARVADEIEMAQAVLADHLGVVPTTLAYPFWAYDGVVVRAVRAAGLRMAMAKGPVPYEARSDQYFIPRFAIYASLSPRQLLAKIAPYG